MQLALHLINSCWQVCVVSMLPPRAFAEVLAAQGVEVLSLGMEPNRLNLGGICLLIRQIRRFRPSVVHAHMFHANVLARLLQPLSRYRLLCTIHSVLEASRTRKASPLRDLAYRYTDRLCDGTTAVGEAVRSRLIQDRLAHPGRLWTIPNGVDSNRFRSNPNTRCRVRNEQGWENSFVWVAVGRLEFAKDYPTMFRAFQQVRRQHTTTRLAIAGSGRLETELRHLASHAGLTSHIDFLGTRTDIADLLTGCDGYVMSSTWEGTPIALLEACSCALPIVATNTGAVSEVIVPGESGFIVPIGDAERLAVAMSDVMTAHPADRQQFGERARNRVVEHFSMISTLRQYEQAYAKLLSLRTA